MESAKGQNFSNILRTKDDQCTFNNDVFNNNYNGIYPDELKSSKENEGPCGASFLDLSMEVHDRKLTTDLFDKRDFFPFYINPMSYLDSNILSRKCFASFCSAILRIEKTTINPLDMVTRFNFLLMRQGSECTCIVSLLEKIFRKHFSQNIFSDTADKFIKF